MNKGDTRLLGIVTVVIVGAMVGGLVLLRSRAFEEQRRVDQTESANVTGLTLGQGAVLGQDAGVSARESDLRR